MLADASPPSSVRSGDGAIEVKSALVAVMHMGHGEGEELESSEAPMVGAERRVESALVGDKAGVEEDQPLERDGRTFHALFPACRCARHRSGRLKGGDVSGLDDALGECGESGVLPGAEELVVIIIDGAPSE